MRPWFLTSAVVYFMQTSPSFSTHRWILGSAVPPTRRLSASQPFLGSSCHCGQPLSLPTFRPGDAAAAAAKSLQSCPTLCDPRDGSPPGSPCPWDSPGMNTGVGCHFLLQCMKVKSESEVTQSCSTLPDPMNCSPPGSSVHGIFQVRVLEWGAIAFSILLLPFPPGDAIRC